MALRGSEFVKKSTLASPQVRWHHAKNVDEAKAAQSCKTSTSPGTGADQSLRPTIETTVWESLALANAMTAMATWRRYAWHALGALGVIELTAPGRSAHTAAGLRRLGVSGKARHYFDLHAVLDIKHSDAWNREAIAPLVAEDPRRAVAIAEGALIRLEAGTRCFERYRAHLW